MRPPADVPAALRPYGPGMDTLVQLANVTKRYDHDGSPALADVSHGRSGPVSRSR